MNREDFPMLFNNIIYFDNGATTFKPKQVLKKISDYYTEYTANAHRGDYHISLKVDTEYELARMRAKSISKYLDVEDLELLPLLPLLPPPLDELEELLLEVSPPVAEVLPYFAAS